MGSNGTGTSKSSGSNTSVSWYKDRGRGQSTEETEQARATPPEHNNTHVYENYVTENEKIANGGVTRAIIHQESFENEAFLSSQLESPYPYSEDVLDGTDSPPLDCNKTLLSSKSDRTM